MRTAAPQRLATNSLAETPSTSVSSNTDFSVDHPGYAQLERKGSIGRGVGSLRSSIRQAVRDVSTTIARARSRSRSRSANRPEQGAPQTSFRRSQDRSYTIPAAGPQRSELFLSDGTAKGHHRAHSDSSIARPHILGQESGMSSFFAEENVEEPTGQVLVEEVRSGSPDNVQQVAQDASTMADVAVPRLLQEGVPMLKVSLKKQKRFMFRLDPDQGQIIWESNKLKIIPIENIKELRAGAEARYYREQFQLASEYEERWLTIVYVIDGRYKTLHLIAATRDVFQVWDNTLRRLYAVRQKLMSGLGHADVRQAVWEKQFWKGAGGDPAEEQKLDFDEVERMCRRLNINPSRADLMRRFTEADSQGRGYLDFKDFKKFVKALKARPDIEQLYKMITARSGGPISYLQFEHFMRMFQKVTLSDQEMQRIFLRYASTGAEGTHDGAPSPMQNSFDLAVNSTAAKPEPLATSSSTQTTTTESQESSTQESLPSPSSSTGSTSSPGLTIETGVLSLKGFTSFLLSPDNSAFADQHGKVFHDMTRPLPEYLISTSHNTYLVGHQLVGTSTVEGYIRALLHSCRSVELDIFDGETEPFVYHGRTLTTKVPVRDVCAAIAKYAFVASPYPVIISGEIHCSLPQQDMIAQIMIEEFGDALVRSTIDGSSSIEVLPSPEQLKGRILLKAKNLYVSENDSLREKEVVVDTESSSTETSMSDSDFAADVHHEWRKVRETEAEAIKEIKHEFHKARAVFGRVRGDNILAGKNRINSGVSTSSTSQPQKVKMSPALASLLIYTVGVKCRGLNKKEVYAPEHMFSLSEGTTNRIIKQGETMELVKHNRSHLVRIYPKGTRIGSTNYEPHRFWATGAQLVALNWQTFDLGYMINHAMFQRNGRAGYVLKPLALRSNDKTLLAKHTNHTFEVTIISAQQLPKPKDTLGRELLEKSTIDPLVEVSIHIPDWMHVHSHSSSPAAKTSPKPTILRSVSPGHSQLSARTVSSRTSVVKNNGFNPVWQQKLSLPFDLVGDMRDLVFVRFAVKQEDKLDEEPLAVYCASLGSLSMGYRHLPLHDAQLSQYLFSTLFVKLDIHDA